MAILLAKSSLSSYQLFHWNHTHAKGKVSSVVSNLLKFNLNLYKSYKLLFAMKRIFYAFMLSCIPFVLGAQCNDCGKMIIATIVDAPDVDADAIQVCLTGDVADMSIYSLNIVSQVVATDELVGPEVSFPALSGSAGDCFWIGQDEEDAADFVAYYGFAADFYDSSVSNDGRDNFVLSCLGNVQDQFGSNDSGSGANWEFNDGWAKSKDGRCPNGGSSSNNDGIFEDASNWLVSGLEIADENDGDDSLDNTTVAPAEVIAAVSSTCQDAHFACDGIELCNFSYCSIINDQGEEELLLTVSWLGVNPDITWEVTWGSNRLSYISGDPATDVDGELVFRVLGVEWVIEFSSPNCSLTGPDTESIPTLTIGDASPFQSASNPAPDDGSVPSCGDNSDPCADAGVTVGEPCDDLDANTENDIILDDCSCAGTPISPIDPTCDDGMMNGDETGVDCGGSCDPCDTEPTPTCDDGMMNGDETGVDCGGSCDPCDVEPPVGDDVPTMGEWGLIILALLTLNFTMLYSVAGQTQLANGSSVRFDWRNVNAYPFNKAIFIQAAMLTVILLAFTSVYALTFYGFFTTVDVIGCAIAAPIFTYLVHLLVLANNK